MSMVRKRKALLLEVRNLVLHEAGYKCANPACRGILTLDIHHLDYVSNGGGDSADNLIALCPTCHTLHHKGHIPIESVRTWKVLLLSLNEGFDRRSIETLLALHKIGRLNVSGEGVLACSSLIASGLVGQSLDMNSLFNSNTSYLLSQRASQNYAPSVQDFSCYSLFAVLEVAAR
jgi:HNH endonuclease